MKFLLGLAWMLRFTILVSLLGLFEAAKLLNLWAQRLAHKLQRWSTPLEQLPPGAANHLQLHDLRPSQTISRSTFKIHQQRNHKKLHRRPVIPWLVSSLHTLWPLLRNTLSHTLLQLQALSSSATHIQRAASVITITFAIRFARRLLSFLMAVYHTTQYTLPRLGGSLYDTIRNNIAWDASAQQSRRGRPVIANSTACSTTSEPPAAATLPPASNRSSPLRSKHTNELPCLLSEDEQMPSPCPYPRSDHSRKQRRGQTTIYNVVAPEMQLLNTSTLPSATLYYAAITSAIAVLRNQRSLPCRILPLIAAPFAITIRCWDTLQQPSYYFPDNVIK